jgi:hypothetical protein
MLWTIFVILLVLWLVGLVSFHVIGAYTHILLVLALVVLLIQLFSASTDSLTSLLIALQRAAVEPTLDLSQQFWGERQSAQDNRGHRPSKRNNLVLLLVGEESRNDNEVIVFGAEKALGFRVQGTPCVVSRADQHSTASSE